MWRDELPDWFIEKLRTAVEETKPEALLIGEVWEDASNKIAYSLRRRYLLGSELHGVMNYPFRTALLAYLQGGDADDFRESMESVRENYPPAAFYNSMNFLGTHDTPRIMTVLGASRVPESKDARAAYRLSPAERARGTALVKLAALILFSFPGSPTVYYGDELGLEGFEDPLNRGHLSLGPGPLSPVVLVPDAGPSPPGAGGPSAGRDRLPLYLRSHSGLCPPPAGGADRDGGQCLRQIRPPDTALDRAGGVGSADRPEASPPGRHAVFGPSPLRRIAADLIPAGDGFT